MPAMVAHRQLSLSPSTASLRQGAPHLFAPLPGTPPLSPASPACSECSEATPPTTPELHVRGPTKPTEGYFDLQRKPARPTPSSPSFVLTVDGPSGGPTALSLAAPSRPFELRLPCRPPARNPTRPISPLARPFNVFRATDADPYPTDLLPPFAPRLSQPAVFAPDRPSGRPLQHVSLARIRESERVWLGCGCGCGQGAEEEEGVKATVGLGISDGRPRKRRSMRRELDRALGERSQKAGERLTKIKWRQ